MKKNDHVWTFNESALGSGANGAFSLEYHIPNAKLKVDPADLVGSRIWLVAKNNGGAFLYAILTPSTIELYEEGKYKDDYLLTAEPFFSIRLLPRQESREPWRLSFFQGGEEIQKCTDVEKSLFLELIDKNQRIGFAPPSRALLDRVPQTTFNDLEYAVPDQLMSVYRTVAFGDVSRPRSFPDFVSAIGGVALSILKTIRPGFAESEVVNMIAALDPMAKINNPQNKSRQAILRALSSLPPVVDTFLEEIDPDRISPRRFVAKAPSYSSEWLNKTNNAEQVHEKILKDLVLRLKSRGFKVYRSRSFDVFAEKNGTHYLWEIKSANKSNSVAQGEKGIIQLLRYSIALSDKKWKDVSFSLLLQDSSQQAVQHYLSKMSERAGVDFWLYDENSGWPQRIQGVDSKSFPWP